ncbi:glycosyltransferase family 2 protein [Prescottella sp. R16]|uniref:glycosyltransferase n=1 Tax=Prescottella sp. R16 TaxID=3064529 RepID=UPI00272DEF42|nr:glycosyltransferase family 2 protein [Prescottella sp. R16]
MTAVPHPFGVAVRAGAALALAGVVVAVANVVALPRLRPRGDTVTEPVTVIVPARDEADRIAALVADLRAQRGPTALRILIVDDDSADDTAAIVARAIDGDDRFTLIRTTGPPTPGWLGKTAACARGADHAARQADPGRPGVLVFLDADVRTHPDAVAAAVAELRRRNAALLSAWPRQVAVTAAERLVQPLLCWSWFASLPVAVAHRSRRPSMAVACGQFLVFDAAAYTRAGGHATVAGAVTEDLAIARALRRRGERTVVAAAGAVASCRMYTGAGAVRDGYTRWLWSAYGSPAGSAAVSAVVALGYLLPPVAVVVGRGRIRRWALAGYGAAVASRAAARAVETGRRPGLGDVVDAAAHPLSVAGYLYLTAASHVGRRRGRLRWKGRGVG